VHNYSVNSSVTIQITTEGLTSFSAKGKKIYNGEIEWQSWDELHFGYCPDLKEIICTFKKLKVIDVSKNTNLEELNCSGNQLTHLDVSKNTELTEFKCAENQLTYLGVSKNLKLKELYYFDNPLANSDDLEMDLPFR
jgi:Leucine-rich repeat (LRR) protein